MDRLKITVLVENTVGVPLELVGEWGLALLMETPDAKILFDTGAQGHVVTNAALLGVDLPTVDALVLSHGHYDHTGGLKAFLQARGRLPVYAHPHLFDSHCSTVPRRRYIGVPFRWLELESLGADFVWVSEPREIAPGLWVSGEVPRRTAFEKGDARLVVWEDPQNGTAQPDPLRDDMSLYAVTPAGLVVILGCAHAGVVNIIEHAREVTGVDKVYGIIGGTHLGPVDEEQRRTTIDYLHKLNLRFLAANHCTGLPTMATLAQIFGPRFKYAPAGAAFELPSPSAVVSTV
ncbi:MBL fold metallo-hydrolase [Desulforudis sp. 1031]|uniref:MBL fold metallo-hydrolase n=1 Tax=unclassified Candidatus Desulforudis TaxID=2635950 RepID=UPI003CE5B2DA